MGTDKAGIEKRTDDRTERFVTLSRKAVPEEDISRGGAEVRSFLLSAFAPLREQFLLFCHRPSGLFG